MGLVDGLLEMDSLLDKLAAGAYVGGGHVHAAASDKVALDQLVEIATRNLAILESAQLPSSEFTMRWRGFPWDVRTHKSR